ncbi:hypothetical protein SBFV3_gp21 [Sulfolobales Beppu filamentous virus 3]|uniref:Uncharacterized protein n=1 Tax=Sulfolobales Beppu filamentous virus 3 TaxID=2493124 RepID=A0A3Q8Q3V3_9VIRU|nr:hypothetical protein HOU83_gp21 [Sulfolobales Beppu filamentous virus 3]AZI75856.1 hypothetical protein SBFV3_gp21 [Sulfolobales Beppu filamentous virus 3]
MDEDKLLDKLLENKHYFYLSIFKRGYIVCDIIAICDYVAVSSLVVKHCDDVLQQYEKSGKAVTKNGKELSVDDVMYIEKTKKRIEEFIHKLIPTNKEIKCEPTDIGKDVFNLIDMLGITQYDIDIAINHVSSLLFLMGIGLIMETVFKWNIPLFHSHHH